MAVTANFREQAERCRAEAEAATLENVRERCLRSAAAWRAMADRQDRIDTARAEREATHGDPTPGSD